MIGEMGFPPFGFLLDGSVEICDFVCKGRFLFHKEVCMEPGSSNWMFNGFPLVVLIRCKRFQLGFKRSSNLVGLLWLFQSKKSWGFDYFMGLRHGSCLHSTDMGALLRVVPERVPSNYE